MIRWILSNLVEKEIEKDYRKGIAARTLIYLSFFILIVFTLFSFIDGKMGVFYVDFSMLILITIFYLIFKKRNIYVVSNSFLFIMAIGLLVAVYVNEARDSIALWSIGLLFYFMSLYGQKKGLVVATTYFIILFFVMYNFVGVSMTYQGYSRFIFICFILTIVSYSYEYAIQVTLVKLDNMKNKFDKMTKIDALSNLYNRRYFNEIFPDLIKITRREKKLLVFAMIDIDNFKSFNDTYGHLAGDTVLKAVSQSFKDNLKRPDDFVFRLGGEEFGILFKTDSKEDALTLMQKICKSIEELKIAHSDNSPMPHVTVSIGVYIKIPCAGCEYDDIYKASDEALYSAKMNGKNTVVLA